MERREFARLLNVEGELIAEGDCLLEARARIATLEVAREPGEVLKERGALTVRLDSGESFFVSDRPFVLRIWPRTKEPGDRSHRTLYRFHVLTALRADDSTPKSEPMGDDRHRRATG
jgi:hypothetical protein